MAIQHKPKLIENTGSRIVVLIMVITSWLSFVVSNWLAVLLPDYRLAGFGLFWFVITVLLPAALGTKKKND